MFSDRTEAGNKLSTELSEYKNNKDAYIVSILRGGLVVGSSIAKKLNLAVYPLIVKKLRAPFDTELAIGAVTYNGVTVIEDRIIAELSIDNEYIDSEIKNRTDEINRQLNLYGLKESALILKSTQMEAVIVVDDGVATGATVFAAIKYLKNELKPGTGNLIPKIIIAVPVIAFDIYEKIKSKVDEITALEIPERLGAVGGFYENFNQVSDREIIKMLKESRY